ncbi:MAG: redox-sensing transcriptional repressor Rex [Elusimicrobiota bacterium]|jgi:redox-sensing transcriptional repressor|nr:redox-sensing transcriptional repressor Rex [Elusimicrobiota bacterium]
MIVGLSSKIINRLTLYHNILVDYVDKGVENISSPQIASLLKIDDSQVRKDIKFLNNAGVCKIGYCVADLKKSIEKALGFKKKKKAFIAGAGNLGFALAKYTNFAVYGFEILALFDNDPLKIDLSVNGKKVFHISKLPELKKNLKLDIAILTVPRKFAQETVKLITTSGIKYIWNFTPCVLDTPSDIKILNENLVGKFIQFTINPNMV